MRARLRGSKSLLTLFQIKKKLDFPSLADGIAKPHPDMNIKVAAFTVSEKSNNIVRNYNNCHHRALNGKAPSGINHSNEAVT